MVRGDPEQAEMIKTLRAAILQKETRAQVLLSEAGLLRQRIVDIQRGAVQLVESRRAPGARSAGWKWRSRGMGEHSAVSDAHPGVELRVQQNDHSSVGFGFKTTSAPMRWAPWDKTWPNAEDIWEGRRLAVKFFDACQEKS